MSNQANQKGGILLDLHCYGGLIAAALGVGLAFVGAGTRPLFGVGAALVVVGAGLFNLAIRRP